MAGDGWWSAFVAGLKSTAERSNHWLMLRVSCADHRLSQLGYVIGA